MRKSKDDECFKGLKFFSLDQLEPLEFSLQEIICLDKLFNELNHIFLNGFVKKECFCFHSAKEVVLPCLAEEGF